MGLCHGKACAGTGHRGNVRVTMEGPSKSAVMTGSPDLLSLEGRLDSKAYLTLIATLWRLLVFEHQGLLCHESIPRESVGRLARPPTLDAANENWWITFCSWMSGRLPLPHRRQFRIHRECSPPRGRATAGADRCRSSDLEHRPDALSAAAP